ncbi:MAG TPA: iron-containing alcohol dehydrogenase [Bacteroidales bacterium]|nr:iron-containing alcohol dehydrogenase [Bacteroidales bacterium]
MENFTAFNPTALHFGKDILASLGATLKEYGNRVLLVYGQGSVKKSGLYDRIVSQLAGEGFEICEYGGIQSNPLITDVDAAAGTGRQNKIDVILAVGGGSVIDSAKIISVTIPVDHTGWNFFTGTKALKAVPLVTVLTLAATGSEMNPFAVVSNPATGHKSAFGSPLTFPKHSFLDPSLTLTVPRNYTAFGIADLIAHCFEAWFGIGDATLTDRFVVSIVKEAIEFGPQLLPDLKNYELRAKIMFAATMALNGLTMYGRMYGDWGVHSAGHCLSLLYGVPHGASLTIVYPAWLKHFKEPLAPRIEQLGTAIFDTPMTADEAIVRIEKLFHYLNCPVRLSEMGIPGVSEEAIFESMVHNKVNGGNMKMKEDDYRALIGLFM